MVDDVISCLVSHFLLNQVHLMDEAENLGVG